MSADQVDALVIFGATGDLAKLETFPALVGLVERGLLDVPVLGVAKSGWAPPQLRRYAAAAPPPRPRCSAGSAMWTATSGSTPPTRPWPRSSVTRSGSCTTWRCRPSSSA